MADKEWKALLGELVYQVTRGAKPVAEVSCLGATRREVDKALAELEDQAGQHARFSPAAAVRGALFQVVEEPSGRPLFIVISCMQEMLDLHQAMRFHEDGFVRDGLRGFLYGYSAESIAAFLSRSEHRTAYSARLWRRPERKQRRVRTGRAA